MGLDHDRGLNSACLLFDCVGLICDRMSSGSFLARVAQNSFFSFSEAHNHHSQCCGHAWGSYIGCCHCGLEVSLYLGAFLCCSSLRKCRTSDLLNLVKFS
jgi:hypothetical protein